MRDVDATSKFLSMILRHRPQELGIKLDEHGWADVQELIAAMSKTQRFTMKDLELIVNTDKKGRYAFNEDKTKIRANQGHSIKVDVELQEEKPPKTLYHGTGEKYVSSIDRRGLIPKSRLYVHMSANRDTAIEAGRRHGNPVLYLVDAEKMSRDGHKFFLSENGVWLAKTVPPKYLIKCMIIPGPRHSDASKHSL